MEMHSEFLELLHEERWTEISKGTKGRTFVAFFPELTQSHNERILLPIAAHTDNVPVMLSVLPYRTIYCTNTVQTVQSATELYLQYLQ